MELKEYTSKNLNVPYVYLKDKEKYLCSNGVLFSKEEYLNGIDLQAEYVKREREEQLYDYAYAKSTGLLRKKRGTSKTEEGASASSEMARGIQAVSTAERRKEVDSSGRNTVPSIDTRASGIHTARHDSRKAKVTDSSFSIKVICLLLAFTSAISMYISTLHTATYLKDYVDLFSAWLMSASVTAYNGTAFEVSVLFHNKKRNFIATVFMILWIFVTLFSMTTTVSVFYDQYNFNESSVAEENKFTDSSRLQLEMLQKKEADLRESIDFKKKDIEYRQQREWATSAVRAELNSLESELQSCLEEQKNILSSSPEASKSETEAKKKETLFAFLGRMLNMEGGMLEFIMSTLSAIFVNLIAPLSLTAVIELLYKKEEKNID